MELSQLVRRVGIRVNNVKPVDIFAFEVVFSFLSGIGHPLYLR